MIAVSCVLSVKCQIQNMVPVLPEYRIKIETCPKENRFDHLSGTQRGPLWYDLAYWYFTILSEEHQNP